MAMASFSEHETQPAAARTPGNRPVRVLLTLAILVCVTGLGFSSQFYTQALVDAFFGLALAGITIIHLRIRPRWQDALLALAGMVLLSLVDFQVLHYKPSIIACFSNLGLTSFMILAVRSVWDSQRKILLYGWVPAGLLVLSDYLASDMLEWTSRMHPRTLDLYLMYFDGNLGTQISFVLGRYDLRHLWFHNSTLIGYAGLAIPITLVYAGRLVRFGERALPSVLAFLITGPIGMLFYNLFPACGPHKLFGPTFPFQPFPTANLPRLFLEPVAITGPRNAIPSLHIAWTLLAWWYSRGLSWIERLVALAFLLLTAGATLGTGEHWFVDLVVAVPFALMIQGLAMYELPWSHRERLTAILAGLSLTLGWLAVLRYGVRVFGLSPIVPWTFSIATVALACFLQARLAHAADSPDPAQEILRSQAPVLSTAV